MQAPIVIILSAYTTKLVDILKLSLGTFNIPEYQIVS